MSTPRRTNEREGVGGHKARRWPRLLQLATLAIFILTGGAGAPQAQAPAVRQHRARLDAQVASRLARAGESDTQPVIISVRRGAKRGLLRALQAQGVGIGADFSVIEGFSGRMSARLLRALEQHPDVLGISTDAPVYGDGIASDVVGTPMGSAYSLRSTLGLESAPIAAGATTSGKGSTDALSFSHTVPNADNRLLVVRTAHRDGSKTVTRVTYGGVALTKLTEQNSTGNSNKATLWYRLNPPPGTASVVVTLSGGVNVTAAATTFTGVNQSDPFGDFISTSGKDVKAGPAQVSLKTAAGDVMVDVLAANGDAKSVTAVAAQTVQHNDGTGTSSGNIRGGASSLAASDGTTTTQWTMQASKPWALVAATIKPASDATTSLTGAGVTVAVLDSGLVQDGGGSTRIKTTRDFTRGSSNPSAADPVDGVHAVEGAGHRQSLASTDRIDPRCTGTSPGGRLWGC